MARTMLIRPPAGFDNPAAIDLAVLEPITPTGNLGSIVDRILGGATEATEIVVDIDRRRIAAGAVGDLDALAAVEAATGATPLAALAPVEDVRTALWSRIEANHNYTVTPGSAVDAFDVAIRLPAAPRMNIASLVSKIEDVCFAEGAEKPRCLVVIDQTQAEVRVFQFDTDAHRNAAMTAMETPAPIRYEQDEIPAPTGEETLAFE